MWFKLAGATFTNNLGTMSDISNAWSVSCTTSGGITKTAGSGMVTKGGTWTGTFTLSEGATFTSATLTPSSAGTVTSTPSGSTVTVKIEKVSANCTLAVVATGGSSSGGGDSGGGNILFTQEDYSSSASAAIGVALYDDTMELIRNKSIGSVKVYSHGTSSTFKICKVSDISNDSTNTSLITIQTASLVDGWNTITFSSAVTFGSNEFLVMYDNAKTFGYSSTAALGFYTFNGTNWTTHAPSTKFAPTIVIYAASSSGGSGTSTVLYSNETYISTATGSEGVLFSDSTMNSLRGKTITSIKVYAHSASSTFKIIKKSNISNNLADTTPTSSVIQTASLTEGWNTITFTTPFTLSSAEWLGMYDDAKTFGYSQTNPAGLYVWQNSSKKWVSYTQYAPTAVVYGY